MTRMIFVLVCFGFTGIGGCTATRHWDGPVVEPLIDGGGVVEIGMYRDMPYVMASVNGSELMNLPTCTTKHNTGVLTQTQQP
ncbi:MAG: hypothetical protein JKX70_08685 [Phycisphaerales bacterium]|nr:hypothetical protein [Phycisphaerales bacterium]